MDLEQTLWIIFWIFVTIGLVHKAIPMRIRGSVMNEELDEIFPTEFSAKGNIFEIWKEVDDIFWRLGRYLVRQRRRRQIHPGICELYYFLVTVKEKIAEMLQAIEKAHSLEGKLTEQRKN